MRNPSQYKTWIELSRRALSDNIKAFRSILKKKTRLYAVVKSNAYGHGLVVFSKLADQSGVDGFCVDSVFEGHKLRANGIHKPILVLGPTLPRLFKEAAADDLTITISGFEALNALKKSRVAVDFHLKIDTGMHRQGFYLRDLPKVIPALGWGNSLKGLYTHFASAKDITYPDYTLRQIGEFNKAGSLFHKAGFRKLTRHAAASGGAILYPRAHFDMARLGIGLYGYWPSKEAEIQHPLIWKKNLALEPVLSWRALVSEVKKLSAGDFVGYDLTERAGRDMKVAIIPIGYWHGYRRMFSGRAPVLINGRRAKVIGRVSMDLIVVGFTGGEKTGIKVGDVATLLGRDKKETITADELASIGGTINYEVLTNINPLIKRIVI